MGGTGKQKKKTLNSITPSLNDFEAEFPFYSFFMLLTFTVLYWNPFSHHYQGLSFVPPAKGSTIIGFGAAAFQ